MVRKKAEDKGKFSQLESIRAGPAATRPHVHFAKVTAVQGKSLKEKPWGQRALIVAIQFKWDESLNKSTGKKGRTSKISNTHNG